MVIWSSQGGRLQNLRPGALWWPPAIENWLKWSRQTWVKSLYIAGVSTNNRSHVYIYIHIYIYIHNHIYIYNIRSYMQSSEPRRGCWAKCCVCVSNIFRALSQECGKVFLIYMDMFEMWCFQWYCFPAVNSSYPPTPQVKESQRQAARPKIQVSCAKQNRSSSSRLNRRFFQQVMVVLPAGTFDKDAILLVNQGKSLIFVHIPWIPWLGRFTFSVEVSGPKRTNRTGQRDLRVSPMKSLDSTF